MRPILANRLFLRAEDVPEVAVARFRHHWEEVVTEEQTDEEGNILRTDAGHARLTRTRVPHTLETFRQLHTLNQSFLSLPRGDPHLIREFLPHVIDLRAVVPFGYPLRVRQRVMDDPRWLDGQADCVERWIRAGASGIITATTGAGKTVMGIAAACRMGLRTLILSKRTAAEGVWGGDFREHTNVEEWEQRLGRPIVGVYKPGKPSYDIAIATVQTFTHDKGYRKLAARDQNGYGLVIADEVNELCSPEFGRILSLWNPLCWLGLTATLDRDDQRHRLALHQLGPIVANLDADQLPPRVEFVHTGYRLPGYLRNPQKKQKREWKWGRSLYHVIRDPDRREFIVDKVARSIREGRFVYVFSERTQYSRDIQEALRLQGCTAEYIVAATPNFVREQYYQAMRDRKLQCICAGLTMDAMVSINPLDCVHVVTPINKRKNIMQVFGRSRRPEEGKEIPLVYYYVDEGAQISGAAKNVRKYCDQEGWDIRTIAKVPRIGMMQF